MKEVFENKILYSFCVVWQYNNNVFYHVTNVKWYKMTNVKWIFLNYLLWSQRKPANVRVFQQDIPVISLRDDVTYRKCRASPAFTSWSESRLLLPENIISSSILFIKDTETFNMGNCQVRHSAIKDICVSFKETLTSPAEFVTGCRSHLTWQIKLLEVRKEIMKEEFHNTKNKESDVFNIC